MQKLYDTKIYKRYHQFFRFCLVGGTNFLISLIVFYFVLWVFSCFPAGLHSSNALVLFSFHNDSQIANVFAFVISVLNAYILNRVWVFRKEARKAAKGAVFRFFASYGVTFFLSIFLIWLWMEVFSISKMIVPFLNVLITTPINFLLSKYFSFRKKKTHMDGIELAPFETSDQEEDQVQ